jgi:hypothetical protein
LAVPNRVAALGGGRILCGRALCRQSLNRRDSALEVSPGFPIEGRLHFNSRSIAKPGLFSPKFFYCAPQYKDLI